MAFLQMTRSDQLVLELRQFGKFVFAYSLPKDRGVSEAQLRVELKTHFEKSMDKFFETRPKVIQRFNEPNTF